MRQRRRLLFSFGVLACSATGVQIVVGPSANVTQTRFTQHFAAAVTHACAPDGTGRSGKPQDCS